MFRCAAYLFPGVCLLGEAFAQTPKIDFARDVQPIFRQNCVGCHGPAQQMNGLRLDRKSSVFKDGARRVVPGSSDNSFLYHRVSGGEYGLQMPPTGPLRPEQIAAIKAWIDQGAVWPDALSNEADLPPADPKAVALVEKLRTGERQAFLKAVAADAKLLNARGPEGSTPFMYAALYGDAALLEQLIQKGADPNRRNDAKATALMWAASDLEKTRVLVRHGADVNAISEDKRTPLMIAAGHPGGTAIVKFLIEHGAQVNPTKNPMSEPSPLAQAALAGDPESMQLLLERGAEVKRTGALALTIALSVDCGKCAELLLRKDLDRDAYTFTLLNVAPFEDAKTVKMLLDHGADVNAVDPLGRTALMYAAVSDLQLSDVVKLLVDRGADVNAKSRHSRAVDTGLTALDFALLDGESPVAEILRNAGAKSAAPARFAARPERAATVQEAVQRSLPQIQRADAGFTAKSGCISCHNNSLAAMAVGLGRKSGFRVDEATAAKQVHANAAYVEHQREALHQGFFAPQAAVETFGDIFGASVLGYILVGLDAEHYQPDLNTDAVALYLLARQMPNGWWAYSAADTRQPICNDYIGQTALAMRALQLYAPRTHKAEAERAVRLAARWMAGAETRINEDRFWKLIGLAWAGTDREATQIAMRDVLAQQRPDGGWSDLPTLKSGAYATGRALVALQAAGLPVSDAAYRRGVQFLLNSQMPDGSWHVKTRALALQPYFETGFPHGFDQSISAAGSSWATMALALAAGEKPATVARK